MSNIVKINKSELIDKDKSFDDFGLDETVEAGDVYFIKVMKVLILMKKE